MFVLGRGEGRRPSVILNPSETTKIITFTGILGAPLDRCYHCRKPGLASRHRNTTRLYLSLSPQPALSQNELRALSAFLSQSKGLSSV